ncbi:MAG: SH3 domain-containing protein [Lachnospiraceae bacterium]
MVLEMKRALGELRSGSAQGYRRLYDATYEEVYCRSLLIIQKEDQVLEYMKDFYKDLFGSLDEAYETSDTERWFLHRFYQKLRKHYHRLLEKQEKAAETGGVKTLAELPNAFPLLHRIMLTMSFKDDFSAAEISAIYGLAEDKIQTELEKLEKLLPSITEGQPESVGAYLGSWKVLLLGASRQITGAGSDGWVDSVYADAAKAAGIPAEPSPVKSGDDQFEYFVADPEPEPEKPKKKVVPIVREEPDEEEEDEDEDAYDEDEDDEDEYDEDEDEDEDDDRYDWDMEDDGRKMIILGIVLAVIIVAIIGIAAFRILGSDKDSERDRIQSEQEEEDSGNKLIVKGGEDEGSEAPEEDPEPVEAPEETPGETPEEAEALVMRVNGNTINVRSDTNTQSDILTKVKKDEKVEVLGDPAEEWVQIRCIEQNNEEGYMMSQYLSNIE